MTVVVDPVVPVMAPLPDLSEFGTWVAAHACAAQVIELKSPPVPHVATNVAVPAYPVAQMTVVVVLVHVNNTTKH